VQINKGPPVGWIGNEYVPCNLRTYFDHIYLSPMQIMLHCAIKHRNYFPLVPIHPP
jgi:hypothetical protein